MLEVTETDIAERMRLDNPWYRPEEIDPVAAWPKRHYFAGFLRMVKDVKTRRAVVLMGPRRVGKTIMLQQAAWKLIDGGVSPHAVLYLALDTPVYNRIPLDRLLAIYRENFAPKQGPLYVMFDEIQYLKDWEVHLKSLVDTYKDIKFVASGSAAAALKTKSAESGAGRFTDFLLPPLTFAEFIDFSDEFRGVVEIDPDADIPEKTADIDAVNRAFVAYLNYGGYPELVMHSRLQGNVQRYAGADIVDKVLLRDLPSLYGISDIQELNSLFMSLAYNTGHELSLEGLSQSSQLAKNTLKRYIEYLEAAFLIRKVERIDINARRFQRATSFKVYLTNPSMRASLFGPITADDDAMGALAETAIYAQWFHSPVMGNIRYARWDGGEVDLVYLGIGDQQPKWAVEVKWSDRAFSRPGELKALQAFVGKNPPLTEDPTVTTRTQTGRRRSGGVDIDFTPTAVYCYMVGMNLITALEVDQQLDLLS